MITLATFILGGTLGAALWIYLSGFADRLKSDVYTTYVELFPHRPPAFQPHKAALKPQKCGHILAYFCAVGGGFVLLRTRLPQDSFTLWCGATLLILWAVADADWRYQLISPTPCLWLLALGGLGTQCGFSGLTLAESLSSAVGFFGVFYGIYHIAKWVYKTEAFGRGDYWLALGLGSLIPLKNLPHFLLLACVLGISYALLLRRKKQKFLPFAPFMCLAAVMLRGIDFL